MEKYNDISDISEETVAAWLDGHLSSEEDDAFVESISSNVQFAEILDAYEDIESDFEHLIEDGYELPAELNFDFQLPFIDDEVNFELSISNFDSAVGILENVESEEFQENDEGYSDSSEYYEDSDESHDATFYYF